MSVGEVGVRTRCAGVLLFIVGCSGDPTTDGDTGTTSEVTPPECRTYTQPIDVGGTIDTDTAWLCNTVPYVVGTDVSITKGAILTVGPGVTVQVANEVSIVVGNHADGGGIVADGTVRPITFTSTQGVQSAGDWQGIVIDANATQAVLRNVSLLYAGDETSDGSMPGEGAVVVIGRAEITDTTIEDSASNGVHFVGEGRATAFSGNTMSRIFLDAIRVPVAQLGGLSGPNTIEPGSSVAVEGGTVTADATWADLGAPYHVLGQLIVQGSGDVAQVEIEAGTVWRFEPDAGLLVGRDDTGAVMAVGTESDPIVFTSSQQTPAAEDWPGILVDSNATDAVFRHVEIRWAGAETLAGSVPAMAGLTVVGPARASVVNSVVRGNAGHGVAFLSGGEASSFTGNDFADNAVADVFVEPMAMGSLGAGNTFGAEGRVQVAAGEVSASVTWPALGAPCQLQGDVFVQGDPAPVLTVAAGAHLQFEANAALVVGFEDPGGIVADGTSGSPIRFTSTDPANPPGSWEGVVIDRNATQATFAHAVFEGGGDQTGDFSFAGEAALIVYDATASVTDSTFANNAGSGMALLGNAALSDFDGNTFSANGTSTPITARAGTVASLSGSHIFQADDRVVVRPGTVDTSGTWSDLGIPFRIIGDVLVQGPSSPVLTIAPNTQLQLGGQVALVVGSGEPGGIVADGTSGRISLSSEATKAAAGDWEALVLDADALDASEIRAVDFAHCGDPTSNTGEPFSACLGLNGVDATIASCSFTDSAGHGIQLRNGANPTMSGNSFTNIALDDVNGP